MTTTSYPTLTPSMHVVRLAKEKLLANNILSIKKDGVRRASIQGSVYRRKVQGPVGLRIEWRPSTGIWPLAKTRVSTACLAVFEPPAIFEAQVRRFYVDILLASKTGERSDQSFRMLCMALSNARFSHAVGRLAVHD